MSIAVMTRVWSESQQKGSRLLLLLAIADHADEMGFAWPGITLLAEKIRMSVRQTKRLLTELEETGELYVDRAEYHSRYVVTTGMTQEQIIATLTDKRRLAYSATRALETVAVLQKRAQNTERRQMLLEQAADGDNLSPCLDDQHGDISGQHGDIQGQHGDIGVTLIINKEKEDEEDEEEPDEILAAVVALYEQEIGGTITAMIAEELRELTETERNLDRWRKVFKDSIGKGNRWAWIRKVIANPLPKKPQPQARPVVGAGKRPPTAPVGQAERIQEIIQSRNGG